MPAVSIVIPFFNAEYYMAQCAECLFRQTLDDIEYIFVNDGSTDNSATILSEISENYSHRNIHIISLEQNMGVAHARTVGMKVATGTYMIHCDADDTLDADMYEKMYRCATKNDADVVTCNFDAHFTLTTGREMLASGRFTHNLWDKLIRTSIIKDNNIYPYVEINAGEDLNVVVRVLHHSHKVYCLSSYYPYHYNTLNPASITSNNKIEIFTRYTKPNTEKIAEFLQATEGNYEMVEMYLKFLGKRGLLHYGKTRQWCETWSECHKHISLFPLPQRYRRRMAMLANHPTLLHLYYIWLNYRYKSHEI